MLFICMVTGIMEESGDVEMKDKIAKIDAWLDKSGEKLSKKEMKFPVNLTGAVIFLLFGLFILYVMPEQVIVADNDVVNGQVFPRLVVWMMLICSGFLAISEVYKMIRKQPIEMKTINLLIEVKALIIFGIMLLFHLVAQWTNFAVGAVLCAFLMLLFFRCKKRNYYIITIGMAVLIWVAFRFGLNVRF